MPGTLPAGHLFWGELGDAKTGKDTALMECLFSFYRWEAITE